MPKRISPSTHGNMLRMRMLRRQQMQEPSASKVDDETPENLTLYWSACYVVLFWVVCAVLVGLLLLMTECTVSDVC